MSTATTIPDDIKECCAWLKSEHVSRVPSEWDHFADARDDERATEAAIIQILDHLGEL